MVRAAIDHVTVNSLIANFDSPLQEWFEPFSFTIEDFGTLIVQVQVTPLDGKIPLRNLFLPDGSTLRTELLIPWEDMWERLGRRELAPLVLDFLDADTRPRMGGAERETHINRAPLDISELLILEEMTPEILYGTPGNLGVADFSTLWSGGLINLNVAPIHVLEILPGMDRTLAERMVFYRERQAFTGMNDLDRIAGFPPRTRGQLMNVVGFTSQYFQIIINMLEDSGGVSFYVVFNKSTGEIVRWEET